MEKQHTFDKWFIVSMISLFVAAGGIAMWFSDARREPGETDMSRSSIRLDEVVRTSAEIQPINHPEFVTASAAARLFNPQEPVIVLEIGSRVRAYPLSILLKHEIVNDVMNDVYFAVTYCPLCNSAVVYDRRLGDRILTLDVTGNLYKSNFIMTDDQTRSWWHQFTGEAIVGAMTGQHLALYASQVVGFETFLQTYPDGQVLVGDASRPTVPYGDNPLRNYDEGAEPLFSNAAYDERLAAMERVLASVVNGTPVAYPFSYLETVGVVNETVKGEPIVAFWQPGAVSVLDEPDIANSRDVGQAALFSRMLHGRELTFRYEDGSMFDNETGSEWNIFGMAIAGALAGERLTAYACFQHFWFAWSVTYPETLVLR